MWIDEVEKSVLFRCLLFLCFQEMSFLNKIKTFVGKTAVSNATSLTTTSPKQGLKENLSKFITTINTFGEREWQCPCGHKFRDSNEWVVGSPALCEVPSCPNRKYYVNGPGRALLEANPGGINMKPVSPNSSPLKEKTTGVGSRIR